MSLHQLGVNALGVKLNGPKTTECQHCSLAKIKRQISRRPPNRERDKPGLELHIDWTDLEEAHAGFVRVMFIHDSFSGRSFPYFMTTHGEERETLRILKDFIPWIRQKYKLKVDVIRSDNELGRKKTLRWLRTQTITFEPSAPRTQDQNGTAERSGGVVIGKARAMRIGANLPHDLWDEIVNCAVYLRDRTPRESNGWESPYEKFHTFLANGRVKKPQLAHLKAYGCRAYAMTSNAQLKKERLRKLDPRAHIGYLVGYDSTNIYRIWIPHKGVVISTRDVIFDETTFFDNKRTDFSDELIAELDTLIEKIKLPGTQAKNEALLEDDEEILETSHQEEDDDDDVDNEPIQDFNEVEDLELAKALEEAYLTPPPSEEDEDSPYSFHVQYPIDQDHINRTGDGFNPQGVDGDTTKDSFNAACDDRFEDFVCEKITSTYHGAFTAGRKFNLDSRLRDSFQTAGRKRDVKLHKTNLPPPPQSIQDLETHPLRDHFKKAQRAHLESRSHSKR